MNNKALLDKCRAYFTVALILTIAVASLLEIVAYFIFIGVGKCQFSFSDSYLKYKVGLPILLNCCIFLLVVLLNTYSKFSHDVKNEIIVHGASAVSLVISIFHREFIVTSGTFLFPMMLSSMFNNKKLVIKTFIISAVSLTATMTVSLIEKSVGLTNMMNYFAMYGFLVISFFACYVSIKFSELNFKTIEKQSRVNNKLQNIILLDPMTELYNHRTFYDKLEDFIEEYHNESFDFCLALIDIDNFKHVNDLYGHDCGDIVLKTLANIMKDSCDDYDMAFRYGGEEFAIIFGGKTLEESCQILSYISNVFSRQTFPFTTRTITFSSGVSEYDGTLDREHFFNSVDKLLYKAKNNGKNQIAYYND